MTVDNESYYSFFLNASQVKGYKGFVGFGIRELNTTELSKYCINSNSATLKSPPLIQNQINFTSDFKLRTFTSGCYFYDVDSGKWCSDGLEVLFDTNLEMTHCSSNHLTSFAGGLVILPNAIYFENVWANASFTQNPIIYSIVIAMICIYFVFLIWTRYMDKKDLKKINIIPLFDRMSCTNYFYEILVLTGDKKDAATDSNVIF